MLCEQLLAYHVKDSAKAQEIATTLNSKYPSHSYPILLHEAAAIGLPVKALTPEIDDMLIQLDALYNEMGQRATTDFDKDRYHDNEIVNILEAPGAQVYYQKDKEVVYRPEEKRWINLHNNSSWRMNTVDGEEIAQSKLHLA